MLRPRFYAVFNAISLFDYKSYLLLNSSEFCLNCLLHRIFWTNHERHSWWAGSMAGLKLNKIIMYVSKVRIIWRITQIEDLLLVHTSYRWLVGGNRMYVCMYVWMYVCMYVCVYVCMYLCMYVCVYLCMCMCMNGCTNVCIWYMIVCVYDIWNVCMIYECICMYVYTYIYIYVGTYAQLCRNVYVYNYVYLYM